MFSFWLGTYTSSFLSFQIKGTSASWNTCIKELNVLPAFWNIIMKSYEIYEWACIMLAAHSPNNEPTWTFDAMCRKQCFIQENKVQGFNIVKKKRFDYNILKSKTEMQVWDQSLFKSATNEIIFSLTPSKIIILITQWTSLTIKHHTLCSHWYESEITLR